MRDYGSSIQRELAVVLELLIVWYSLVAIEVAAAAALAFGIATVLLAEMPGALRKLPTCNHLGDRWNSNLLLRSQGLPQMGRCRLMWDTCR